VLVIAGKHNNKIGFAWPIVENKERWCTWYKNNHQPNKNYYYTKENNPFFHLFII